MPLSHVLRVAGVEGEHSDGDELDDGAEEPEAEDIVEVLEEVALFQRVPLNGIEQKNTVKTRSGPANKLTRRQQPREGTPTQSTEHRGLNATRERSHIQVRHSSKAQRIYSTTLHALRLITCGGVPELHMDATIETRHGHSNNRFSAAQRGKWTSD